MCGIAGIWRRERPIDEAECERALSAMDFRGPDAHATFIEGEFGLGSRRLAIVGGPQGAQPFFSGDGSIVVVYNGEIYNHAALAKRFLPEQAWPAEACDGAILPDLFKRLGPSMFRELDGMFGIAVLDRLARRLYLARDRFGIKPLYFTSSEGLFAFASSIGALRNWVRPELDPESLSAYLALGYVPRAASIFKGIQKVLPAHWLCFDGQSLQGERFWAPPERFCSAPEHPLPRPELIAKIAELLRQAITQSLGSDTGLGIFASGGLDSGAVLEIAAQQARERIAHVVTVALLDCPYDESIHAQALARRHGIPCTVAPLDAAGTLRLLPEAVRGLDEPIGDPALIPSYVAAEAMRPHARCVLTGIGGDEVFAGYSRYLRKEGADYFTHMEYFNSAERQTLLARGDIDARKLFEASDHALPGAGADEMIRFDLWSYLSDQILPLCDKVSMFASLEARVPLLGNDLAEFMFQIPANQKLDGGLKSMLKELLRVEYAALGLERPKQGFGAPLHLWLMNQADTLKRSYIDDSSLVAQGYLKGEGLKATWKHLSENIGASNRADKIWLLVTLEAWHRHHLHQPK